MGAELYNFHCRNKLNLLTNIVEPANLSRLSLLTGTARKLKLPLSCAYSVALQLSDWDFSQSVVHDDTDSLRFLNTQGPGTRAP